MWGVEGRGRAGQGRAEKGRTGQGADTEEDCITQFSHGRLPSTPLSDIPVMNQLKSCSRRFDSHSRVSPCLVEGREGMGREGKGREG